jgi:hypothetical protein
MKVEILGQVIHHSLFHRSLVRTVIRNDIQLFYLAIESCELGDAPSFQLVFDHMVTIFAALKFPPELEHQAAAARDGLRHTRDSILVGNPEGHG